jgi:hypothetical protein
VEKVVFVVGMERGTLDQMQRFIAACDLYICLLQHIKFIQPPPLENIINIIK